MFHIDKKRNFDKNDKNVIARAGRVHSRSAIFLYF